MDQPTAPDAEQKSKSKSVSLPPDMWDRIEARASARYGGNRSAYLRELVERDERGEAQRVSALSATVLQDLAAVYLPTRAAQLTDELVRPAKANPADAIDQPVVVENFLGGLLRALREPGFEPEAPFDLADAATRARWDKITSERIAELADGLAASLGKGSALSFVAEPQAPYGASIQPPPKKSRPLKPPAADASA